MKQLLLIALFITMGVGFTAPVAMAQQGNQGPASTTGIRQNVVVELLKQAQPIFYPETGMSLGELNQAYRRNEVTITRIDDKTYQIQVADCLACILLATSDF